MYALNVLFIPLATLTSLSLEQDISRREQIVPMVQSTVAALFPVFSMTYAQVHEVQMPSRKI